MRLLLLTALLCAAAAPAAARSPACGELLADYRRLPREARQPVLDRIVQDERLGLSCLEDFLDRARAGDPKVDYEAVLAAVAALDTKAAAKLLYREIRTTDRPPRVPARHLAAMGGRGLPFLAKLARKKKFALTRSPDELPVHPHFYAPPQAAAAAGALSLIRDREAAPGLLALAAHERLSVPALRALGRMGAAGAEERALMLWSGPDSGAESKAAALGYLLSIDRERYHPLLARALSDFSAEVQRCGDEGAPLPRELRPLLVEVLHLGGDPAVVEPFSALLRSKTWRAAAPGEPARDEAALAALALGLTRSSAAREPLLGLQGDESRFPPLGDLADFFAAEHPAWPRILSQGAAEKTGAPPVLPAAAVASVALGELGPASAAPAAATPAPPEPRP